MSRVLTSATGRLELSLIKVEGRFGSGNHLAFTQHFAPGSAKWGETGTFMANFLELVPLVSVFNLPHLSA